MKDLSPIVNNTDLRPYFFDLMSKNIIIELTQTFKVNPLEQIRYQKEYADAMQRLSEKLKTHLSSDEEIYIVMEEASYYFLSRTVGANPDLDLTK